MAGKRRIFTFLLVLAISFSLACGSNGSGGSSSQQVQASVSIALKPAPATTSIPVASATGIQFTPVVSNDPANSGVDWALTCPLTTAGGCGTLNISNFHSASGTAVNYIPPAYFFTGALSVNVTAFATSDHTKNVTTLVTVTSYSNVLNGTYVLQLQGTDPTPNPYQSTGVFVFDGNGNITSGQQTLNTVSLFSTTYTVQGSGGAASTYFVGPDGRGNMTLNLQQTSTAVASQETFTFTVISSAQAQVAEIDANSGSGTLELQDTTAAGTLPTGAYAFVASGTDAGNPNGVLGFAVPTALGGVFNIDNNPSTGSISGNGSLADRDYYNSAFSNRVLFSCVPPTGVTGAVSQPISPGIVTITLTGSTCFGPPQPVSIQFTGYIVDATHIRLIESDDLAGTSGFLTAGIAVGQGSAAGTFTNASLTGPYVFGVLGYDINEGAAVSSSFTAGGVVDAAGNGRFAGIDDYFFLADFAAFTANPLTGAYTTDANLVGRVDLSQRFAGQYQKIALLFYLTGNGTPPLVFWAEGEDLSFPAIGTGIAYPQAANASTLSFGNPETYSFSLTQNNGSEIDSTGDILTTVNGVTGSVTGMIENINSNDFSGSGAIALSDTFTLPGDEFGRIAGTFMNTSGTLGPYFEYYLVDDNHGFMEETDLLDSSQVSLGYFAQSCDVTNATSCAAAASQSSARALRKSGSRSLRKNSEIAVH